MFTFVMTDFVLKLFLKTFLLKLFKKISLWLYSFFMTDEGIKINVLVLRFTSPLISKEIHSLNKVTILKERICRTERHLSFLKSEKSLVNQLIDNIIKKFKPDIEIEIYSYSSTTFLHRHRHIVQTPCEKEFNGKDIKDETMLTFSQYEWIDSLTDIPSKIVINNILILFTIVSNIHTKDVLITKINQTT